MFTDEQAVIAQVERRREKERARQHKWSKGLERRGLKKVSVLINCSLLQGLDDYAEDSGMSRSEALNDCLGSVFTKGNVTAYKNWLGRGKLKTILTALAALLDRSIEQQAEALRAVLSEY